MPRRARLDAPGTLHHVMVRGIERRRIVNDVADRKNFVKRLGKLSVDTNTPIYAWAIMTNHAHILLRNNWGSKLGLRLTLVKKCQRSNVDLPPNRKVTSMVFVQPQRRQGTKITVKSINTIAISDLMIDNSHICNDLKYISSLSVLVP